MPLQMSASKVLLIQNGATSVITSLTLPWYHTSHQESKFMC
jgi:hypothetical protein